MTLSEVIKAKLARLEKVPDTFVNGLDKSEKQFYLKVVALLSKLETKDGVFIVSKNNIRILNEINASLKDLLLETEFVAAVHKYVQEYDTQAKLNDDYFLKAFKDSKIPAVAKDILQIKKETAYNLLLGDGLDGAFINPIKNQVQLAITSKATFSDTLNALQEIITGDAQLDSKLAQYSKQVAYDAFAVSDAAYTQAVSENLKAEWFLYSGDVIPTSRAFCRERHDKYYHKKEVESWGDGKRTTGLRLPDSNGGWDGEMEGTNAQTIFSTRGGYRCQHSLLPVSIFIVPKEVVERVVAQGFYEPSEFEVKELELVV